ncbi:MAG: hypothetical protein HY554_05455 [Elusimicrobia bacterium]|nr:hypothetical protein [Elusimicrobiota bacterium]
MRSGRRVAPLAGILLAALLRQGALPAGAEGPARSLDDALHVLSIKPLKLPWNATRASWERTKEVASTHWRMIPFAQIATGLLFVKTALSTPVDLAAAPFRQRTRSEVTFEIRGRIVDAAGKPAPNAKVIARCTTPWEPAPNDFNYYEAGRFGPAMTDAEGRVLLQATGITGLAPKFMVHLDLEDTPKGAASAGAYSITLSSAGAAVSTELTGSWRLIADSSEPQRPQ